MNGDPPFAIGILVFDEMTNLDFVGPCDIFARVPGVEVHVLAPADRPVRTDSGVRILPDASLADAPSRLDMLCVPGGAGTLPLMEDDAVLGFLRARAPEARFVTSVCTGALVLGAAGLLRGYRAATHWAAMHVLATLGAIPTASRVVIDRDRITGGGVTAGIDFGLTITAMLWGETLAKQLQLGMEYNPEPPFDAGSPDRAPETADAMRAMLAGLTQAREQAAERAMRRLRGAA